MHHRDSFTRCTRIAAVLTAAWALAVCTSPSHAQTTRILPLSLDESLDRALVSSEEMAIARAGILRAEGGQQIAESQYLPQINASLGYSRTLISQYSGLSSGDAPQDTSGGGGGGLAGVLDNLPFGQENSWSIGVTLAQTVFAGGRLHAMKDAADARRRMADIELTTAQAQLLLNVAQAYFDAVLADQMVTIADSAFAQSAFVFTQTELAWKLGQRSEFEMLRARVARDNQVPQQLQRRIERMAVHDRLKGLLNIAQGDSLVLTSGVDVSPARFAGIADTSAGVRAPVRQATENVEASKAQLAIAESERWPFISIVSRFAPVAYPDNIFPVPDDFRTDWTAGFNIAIPLFTGGRIGGNEQVARAGILEAELRLQQAREAAELDARSALRDLAQAEALLAATAGTVEMAERANRIAGIRFREGISTQIDLSDTRLLLEQSLANRARALRNVHVARVRLALLPDLPLGGAGASAQFAMPQSAAAGASSGTGGAAQTGGAQTGGAPNTQGTTGP